ncbi:MAG TPA: hypothetical protein VM492_05140, partial [Sumerlaeia bacterium]|nr:hypothetical protein [Sumerlaeia bacterium]
MGSTPASDDGSFHATGGSAPKTALAVLALLLCVPLAAEAQTTASLRVIIAPQEAIDAGAQWRVDGGAWLDSGETTTGLSTHRAEVAFSDVAGWRTPDPAQIWVLSGIDRATTATYGSVPSFAIGKIPSLQAWEGQTLQFHVFSDELGASAILTAVADPAPAGPMTSDLGTSEGLFVYTPAPEDDTPFDAVFTAFAPGGETETQRVTITPLPIIPQEQEIFGGDGMTLPGAPTDDKPKRVIEDIGNSATFNLAQRPTLRKITITGPEVVFEPGHPHEVYDLFNHEEDSLSNLDIAEMVIEAPLVVFRAPMWLPKTKVTINALELRFEDGSGTSSCLKTTPIHEQDPAGPASFDGVTTVTAGNGIDGEAAGDIALNITAFHSDGGPAERFILRGARGQDGGDHFGGMSGDSMDDYGGGVRTDVHGIVYTAPLGYKITYVKWTDHTALGAPIPLFEDGDPNKWPGDGSPAIAAGNAGDG